MQEFREEPLAPCEPGRALALAGRAGCLLLQSGAEIFRVQETMTRMLNALGVTDSNVYVISNGIFATVNEGAKDALSMVRHVPLGSVNLARIDLANRISRAVCDGGMTADEAERELDRAEQFVPERKMTHVLCSGIGAGAFAILFGGSMMDGAAAFAAGVLLQMFLFSVKSKGFLPYVVGSFLVTVVSALAAALFPALVFDRVVIGSIIPLVPGVVFSTSIREFFNGDYLSGLIHLVYAVLTAVCIALGVSGAILVAGLWGGVA